MGRPMAGLFRNISVANPIAIFLLGETKQTYHLGVASGSFDSRIPTRNFIRIQSGFVCRAQNAMEAHDVTTPPPKPKNCRKTAAYAVCDLFIKNSRVTQPNVPSQVYAARQSGLHSSME